MNGFQPLPENEKRASRAITLYFDPRKRRSLREVARMVKASPTTVSNWISASGRSPRGQQEAQRSRSTYPKEWICQVCSKSKMVNSWKEARKKTCGLRCWKVYIGSSNSRRVPDKKRGKALALLAKGLTYEEVAEKLKISRTTVWRIKRSET